MLIWVIFQFFWFFSWTLCDISFATMPLELIKRGSLFMWESDTSCWVDTFSGVIATACIAKSQLPNFFFFAFQADDKWTAKTRDLADWKNRSHLSSLWIVSLEVHCKYFASLLYELVTGDFTLFQKRFSNTVLSKLNLPWNQNYN